MIFSGTIKEAYEHFLPSAYARIDELSKELRDTMNAFVHMVSSLTGTNPDPCRYGDPECAGDISEEATKIVDKVLAGEMKLYEVEKVNALKATTEPKIIKGMEDRYCRHCRGYVGEARYLESHMASCPFKPRSEPPNPDFRTWGDEARNVALRGFLGAVSPPACPGSGCCVATSRREPGPGYFWVSEKCPSCSIVLAVRLNNETGSGELPKHMPGTPATAVSDAVQPRSEGEAGVDKGRATEAPEEAATEPWREVAEKSYRATWVGVEADGSSGRLTVRQAIDDCAKEAYEAGVIDRIRATGDGKRAYEIHEKAYNKGYDAGWTAAHDSRDEEIQELRDTLKIQDAEVARLRGLVGQNPDGSEKAAEVPVCHVPPHPDSDPNAVAYPVTVDAENDSAFMELLLAGAESLGWFNPDSPNYRGGFAGTKAAEGLPCRVPTREAIAAYPLLEREIRKYEKDGDLVTLLKAAKDQAFDKGVARGREIEQETRIGESIAREEEEVSRARLSELWFRELIEKVRFVRGGYKVPGKMETYDSYHEGWDDALDTMLGELEGKSLKEAEPAPGGAVCSCPVGMWADRTFHVKGCPKFTDKEETL